MRTNTASVIRRRRRHLHAVIAALLGLEGTAAHADWTVTSCGDDLTGDPVGHTGTLRYAAANASSGDFVYFTNALPCSTISLATGAIQVPADSVYFVGPEDSKLTISAKYLAPDKKDRVFRHTGTGKLTFRNLTIVGGDFYLASGLVRGGCVFSAGSVYLRNSTIELCQASTKSSTARGGAVYASKDLLMTYGSAILAGTADGGTSGDAEGGGAYVLGDTLVEYSTIAASTASSNDKSHGIGGGLIARGSASIVGSSIHDNYAAFNVGGLLVDTLSAPSANHVNIVNSTISGNSAGFKFGGGVINAPDISIRSSTIAFNETGQSGSAQPAGLQLVSDDISANVEVESTIISNNTSNGSTASDFYSTESIFGSHNLIFKPQSAVPADTLTGVCPRLGRLRSNGGVTLTHALLTGSPARDVGTDSAKDFDQRGRTFINHTGDFARVSGSQADIGAYEINQADIVFNVDFEACTP